MVSNLFGAPVVRGVRDLDAATCGGVDVDNIHAGAVPGDDTAAREGVDGARTNGRLLGKDAVGLASVREVHLGEGLCAAVRVHAFLFGVGRDRPFADSPAGVAGTAGRTDRLFVAQGANGAQNVDLAVAQIAVAGADRRLHSDQAEELQEMVLQHVLESSSSCFFRIQARAAGALTAAVLRSQKSNGFDAIPAASIR